MADSLLSLQTSEKAVSKIRELALVRIEELQKSIHEEFSIVIRMAAEQKFFVEQDGAALGLPSQTVDNIKSYLQKRVANVQHVRNDSDSQLHPEIPAAFGVFCAAAAIGPLPILALPAVAAVGYGFSSTVQDYVARQHEVTIDSGLGSDLPLLATSISQVRDGLKAWAEQEQLSIGFQPKSYPHFPNAKTFSYPSLHINFSLWKDGENISMEEPIRKYMNQAMLDMHHEGALLVLDKPAHYENLQRGYQSPRTIGSRSIKIGGRTLYERDVPWGTWLNLKKGAAKATTRFENRQPVADSMPELAIAYSLGAIYEGLQRMQYERDEGIPTLDLAERTHPENHSQSKKRFEDSHLCERVLGSPLFEAVRELHSIDLPLSRN